MGVIDDQSEIAGTLEEILNNLLNTVEKGIEGENGKPIDKDINYVCDKALGFLTDIFKKDILYLEKDNQLKIALAINKIWDYIQRN